MTDNTYANIGGGAPAAPAPAAPAATPTPAPVVDPAKPADPAPAAKPADAPAAKADAPADKPNSDPAAKPADKDGAPAKADAPKDGSDGSVEYTDFKVPEGFEMDKDLLAKFLPIAKEGKLSQEAAQSFIDIHSKAIQTMTADPEFRSALWAAEHAGKLDKWAGEVMNDPVVGGANAKEALANSLAAVDALDKHLPGLAALVKDPEIGLGNNLKAVQLFEKLGKMIKSSGGFPAGGNGGSDKSHAEILYPQP